MTKRKPDQVIEYRISLQDKEREILESAVGAYQINRIMTPIVTLMNDVTGMMVLLSLVAGVLGFTFITNLLGPDPSAGDVIDAFLTQREQAVAAGVIIAGVGPLGPSFGWRLAQMLGLIPEKEESGPP